MNSIQRQIQPLNPQKGFNVNSMIKPTNRIQRHFRSITDSTLNPEIEFNVNSIQRQIQLLNPQMGFYINSIQRDSIIKPSYGIQCQFHSKTDLTIKPSNRIQCEFHSKTDSTIKPTKRIQCEFHSKTDSTINPLMDTDAERRFN